MSLNTAQTSICRFKSSIFSFSRVIFSASKIIQLQTALAAETSMAKSGPTRWGILGAGAISSDFVAALKTLPQTEHEAIAVAARDADRAKKFAAERSIPHHFGSYAEFVKFSEIDIVYVGVINPQHKDAVLLAINAGKNVLCEKPMGVNFKEVEEMTTAARAKNVFFMEAYWSRFFPVWQEIRKVIASGEIGDVKIFQACFGKSTLGKDTMDPKLGGGAVTSIGCYLPQLAQFVFGSAKPKKIEIEGFKHSDGADDTTALIIKYGSGMAAHLLMTATVDLPNDATIIGTKGYIRLPENFWCPTKFIKNGKTFEFQLPETNDKLVYVNSTGLAYEAVAVRNCILKGLKESPDMTLADSEGLVQIFDDIRSYLGVKFPQDD